jgi:AAA15 family ATPase/GTPase
MNMIKRIRIENFRSLVDVTVDLDPQNQTQNRKIKRPKIKRELSPKSKEKKGVGSL